MKQVIQSYRTGELELAEVPAPGVAQGTLLVRNVRSLVSVGTERYMLDLARKSLLGKAMARPDLVRQVVQKVRSEGISEAWRQSMGRLENPVPLGYSSAGIVLEVGEGCEGFSVGQRVACAGSGHASHAEIVRLPPTLVATIPESVSLDDAAFVTVGGIATHGVRMAEPQFGERVVVLGLGLLGLLAVQILKAAGCRVLGADVAEAKVRMALEFGADAGFVTGRDDPAEAVRSFSGAAGADAVLIFAATESNEPIEMAAEMARPRGRIVVPGLVGLDLPRKAFYEKELSFVVSRAWGPGLYDPAYEEKGIDYPAPFVRWTARRNMEQFLESVADGKVRVAPLVTHRFPFERAVEAYERILEGKERVIGVLLEYSDEPSRSRTIRVTGDAARAEGIQTETRPAAVGRPGRLPVVRAGLVGAGLFARGTLLPAMKGVPGLALRAVATGSGPQGHHVARRYGIGLCTTSSSEVIADPEVDLVMILTRHGSHARLAGEALRAGKHVFVEKPLALDEGQLANLEDTYGRSAGQLMVGFNRRYAPATRRALELLEGVSEPLVISIRVNAGRVPPESWIYDREDGGGRIVGEICHFVDLAQALSRSVPVSVLAESIPAGSGRSPTDDVIVTLRMANGSIASIVYASAGDKSFGRERVEIIGGGAVCLIDNFRTMSWVRGGRRSRLGHALSGVDRGYRNEIRTLVDSLRKGEPFPVPFEEMAAATRATFAAEESLRSRRAVDLPPPAAARRSTDPSRG